MIQRPHAHPIASAVTLAVCLLAGACGGGSGAPAPSGPNYAGAWTGVTAQAQPISFTISTDQRATAISVGYAFEGCSGVQTFSNLNYSVLFSVPASFIHTAMLPDARIISIRTYFLSEKSVHGFAFFYGSASCGGSGTSVAFDAERP